MCACKHRPVVIIVYYVIPQVYKRMARLTTDRALDWHTSPMSVVRGLKRAFMTVPTAPIHLVTTQWMWACTVMARPQSVRMLVTLVAAFLVVVYHKVLDQHATVTQLAMTLEIAVQELTRPVH